MTLSLATVATAQDDAQSKKKRQKGNQPAAAQKATRPGQTPDRPAKNAPQPGKSRASNQARHEQAPASADEATAKSHGNMATGGKSHGKQKKQPRDTTAATTVTKPAALATTDANQPTRKRNARKTDPQVVQKVRTEHVNFKAQPRPNKVPTVTYSQSYRITGAQNWQGPQYEVFRTYQPQWHDSGWYRTRYTNVQIIAGGAYYFSNGFWFPAWGYDPAYQYYAYDAPIYVGSNAEPPDRVIADVQAILQDQGYYKGEVDGLLGPLTREALIEYQTDNGLYATAMIDEPTLAALDLG